ncbi:MAG: hypothetical protein ACI9PY_000359 [Ascidiaceihabitans sp.]|jgi:hypothetical protein
MKKQLFAVLAASSVALGACAQKAEKIEAAEISPVSFTGLSCKEIGVEAKRVSGRVGKLTGQQNKSAKDDAVATGVALVVFWPAAFFIKGNKTQAAELSQLKGELIALEAASNAKKCGFIFQKTPTPAE